MAQLRKIAGYRNQYAFADALGVSRSAVQWWEKGERAPRDEMKARIAGLLNVEVATIFPIEPIKGAA